MMQEQQPPQISNKDKKIISDELRIGIGWGIVCAGGAVALNISPGLGVIVLLSGLAVAEKGYDNRHPQT